MIEPHDPAKVTLFQQLQAANRELALRKRVFPRLVERGSMTPRKAGEEIAAMEAIIETLTPLAEATRLL